MADGEKRANNCGTATFGYDARRRAFALIRCAQFSDLLNAIPQGVIYLDRNDQRSEGVLSDAVGDVMSETCRNCNDHQEGVPTVDRYQGVGEGTDGEYYGGEHQEWTDAIPTGQVSEVMQQMGA